MMSARESTIEHERERERERERAGESMRRGIIDELYMRLSCELERLEVEIEARGKVQGARQSSGREAEVFVARAVSAKTG